MCLLLDIAGRFTDDVIDDLDWLKSKTGKYAELGNPKDGHHIAQRWLQIALDHPQAWKSVLKEVRDDEILRMLLAQPARGGRRLQQRGALGPPADCPQNSEVL